MLGLESSESTDITQLDTVGITAQRDNDMNAELDEALIKTLQTVDTPTVCNALELLLPKRRGYGFTTSQLVCTRPELPPMVGYARTRRSARHTRPICPAKKPGRCLMATTSTSTEVRNRALP